MLAAALLKQILILKDFDTWAALKRKYLPKEFLSVYSVIEKHINTRSSLPTFEELKLSIRDEATLDKVFSIEAVSVDADPPFLLECLRNRFAQTHILVELDKYIEQSTAYESAEELIRGLQALSVNVETEIEPQWGEDSMQSISLFESEEDMGARFTLGLNADFDNEYQFMTTDLVMIGGKRGAGKSLICNNVARHNIDVTGKDVLFFSTEMQPRQVLWRDAALATNIPFNRIRNKSLDIGEWSKLATFWASRFEDSEAILESYLKDHRSFERLHKELTPLPLSEGQLDVVYDHNLTVGRVRAELEKRILIGRPPCLVIVDYMSKVMMGGSDDDWLDWKHPMYVSKAFKRTASDTKIPFLSPYQIDASGEARISKGILDEADVAMILEKNVKEAMSFKITKMRNASDEKTVSSKINWETLKIGPENYEPPEGSEDEDTERRPAKGGMPKEAMEGVWG